MPMGSWCLDNGWWRDAIQSGKRLPKPHRNLLPRIFSPDVLAPYLTNYKALHARRSYSPWHWPWESHINDYVHHIPCIKFLYLLAMLVSVHIMFDLVSSQQKIESNLQKETNINVQSYLINPFIKTTKPQLSLFRQHIFIKNISNKK
jgi:hypothetical protein